ncbi:polygalacturonase QRT3 [Heracleum sosnowskyi]|uniref:Polygalacturonase QRT3 n=1 Tax=Heracleum sosnowskyi TaxID=360622 RepID=A0AAD8HYB9_9APIA|nr:polygalacturonase QRT3 [Heracleum sosnowskyi]
MRMQPFPFRSAALLFLVMFLLVNEISCNFLKQKKLYEFETKLVHKTSAAAAAPFPSTSTPKSVGRVYYPIGYGADPTGAHDSSDAILKTIEAAIASEKQGLQLMPGITDMGGVIIDLQGGGFKINKPIRLPAYTGNLVIQGGTFRASGTFPTDRHLVELWSPHSVKLDDIEVAELDGFNDQKAQANGIYYEAITFRDILFDSGFRGGGIFVVDSARIRIVDCFFLHFKTKGIQVQKGHETFISTCFLGAHPTVGGDKGERDFQGTAIDLASNDNAVTDVAIFSAAVGITLRGPANMITGVHCYNKATYFGGVGILVKSGQTRIDNCYLDYNSIIIEDPSQVHVTNGFFLGEGNVVLKAIKGKISGLTIVDNMFTGNAKSSKPTISLDGKFTNIDQVLIDQNTVNGMRLKSTVGKLVVAAKGKKWTADFSSILVFPNQINHIQYSVYLPGSTGVYAGHALTKISDNVVVVESEKEVNGFVSVAVDQYNMADEPNLFI